MRRFEYKYLVPIKQLASIRKRLMPFLVMDEWAKRTGNNEYIVRSIYLDTKNLDFYHEKESGIKKRDKLRIRAYNSGLKAGHAFLEIKRKTGQMIKKYRTQIDLPDLFPLLYTGDVDMYVSANGQTPLAQENAKRFLYQIRKKSLGTALTLHYEREAYFYRYNPDLRITFDKKLRFSYDSALSSLWQPEAEFHVLGKHFILEIKTGNGFPGWLNQILGYYDLELQSVSKYAMCVEKGLNHRFGLYCANANSSLSCLRFTEKGFN